MIYKHVFVEYFVLLLSFVHFIVMKYMFLFLLLILNLIIK